MIILYLTSGGEGERLFNEDGSETPILNHYIELINKIETSNKQLEVSCSVLEKSFYIRTFAIEVPSDGEAKAKIEGLFKINPEKFKALDNKQIIEMRKKILFGFDICPFFFDGGNREIRTTKKI